MADALGSARCRIRPQSGQARGQQFRYRALAYFRSRKAGERIRVDPRSSPPEGKVNGVNGHISDMEALPPGAVRRTSSLQSLWNAGTDPFFPVLGRSRDIRALPDGRFSTLAEDRVDVKLGFDGRLASLSGSRCQQQLSGFAGLRPGGEMRKAMAGVMPGEAENATRLHRLLDDLAGAAYMSFTAWLGWEGGMDAYIERTGMPSPAQRDVTDVCLSYAPGSPSIKPDGRGREEISRKPEAPAAVGFTESQAFHAVAEHDGPNAWRLRRTDIWHKGDALFVDAWFQDSCGLAGKPDRRRIFHEYGLSARVDRTTLTLEAVDVTPIVLPYLTCEAAPATAARMLGHHVAELRMLAPAQLRGTAGCTHLNDMLRSLIDVESLAAQI